MKLRTLNLQNASNKNLIPSPTQKLRLKNYQHPSQFVLTIDTPPQKEKLYNLEVQNITKSTSKFKGRMLTYQTHGLIIYPAKFIPQIPQFCIQQFSKPHEIVLDPFCGCGTTLVEALLLRRNAYGVDINPLAQLISKVKTTPLNLPQLTEECNFLEKHLNNGNNSTDKVEIPFFPNIDYWFSPRVLQDLTRIQQFIFNVQDSAIQNFLLLILASIIRKVSLADNDQLHPAKTKYSKQKEEKTINTYEIFKRSLNSRFPIIENFSQYNFPNLNIQIIEEDATNILSPTGIDLAVTSPPYVNAIDYVRIHKLEAFWAGLLSAEDISPLHRKFIGTENVYKDYYYHLPEFSNKELNQLITRIAAFDKKRAGIVSLYFTRMFDNLREVFRLLRPEAHYCIVIGSNNIRNVHIPTPKFFIQHAVDEIGYRNVINYFYEVINKRLKIPRARHGGNIKKEWIIVLQKL